MRPLWSMNVGKFFLVMYEIVNLVLPHMIDFVQKCTYT